MENQQVPENLAPYELSGVIYPQAFFVKLTYACYLLGFSPAEVSLLVTPLFQALPVFGGYYLGKALSPKSHLDLSFAFVFAFVSHWPRLLAWGSNAFVGGFTLYLICLSLLPSIFHLRNQNRRKELVIPIIGTLFGYMAAIHIAFYEVLFVAAALMLLFNILYKHEQAKYFVKNFFIMSIFSLIPFSVFIHRYITYYPYAGHNIGLPSDVITSGPSSLVSNIELLGWGLFESTWLSPYPPLKFEMLALVIMSGILFFLARKSQGFLLVKTALGTVLTLLGSHIILVILGSGELRLAFLWQVIDPARQALLILPSLCLLMGISNVLLHSGVTVFLNSRFKVKRALVPVLSRITRRKPRSTNIMVMAVVSLMLSFVYLPFVYYSLTGDVDYLTEQYNLFCVTSQDDYELMLWMQDELPINATILINPFDAGGFIPCISGHRVIFPFTGSRASASYEELVWHLLRNNLDITTCNLIRHFNVSHVFVGSQAVHILGPQTFIESSRWNPRLLLGNPNFELIKNIGNAYLFAFTYTDPNVFFYDDFEYPNISEGVWHFFVPKELEGNGTGHALLSSDYAPHGARSFMITAEKSRGLYYANWVYRKIYLWDASNITLSFYMNATTSSPYDFVAVIVSDDSWDKKLYFASPNLHPWEEMIKLSASQGLFTFNLSQIWRERFSSALTTSVYIEVQIVDFDGIKDSGFVDYITIRSEVPDV